MVSNDVLGQSLEDKELLKQNVTPDSLFRQLVQVPKQDPNVLRFKYQTIVVFDRDVSPDFLWGDTNNKGVVWGDSNSLGFVWDGDGFTNDKVVFVIKSKDDVFFDGHNELFNVLSEKVYEE